MRVDKLVGKDANSAVNVEKGLVISGVTTAETFNVTGNLSIGGTITYEDVTNVDSIGIITARKGIVSSGVVTATAFHGDGSGLTGISGFATALSSTPNTLLNECFKTTEAFTVGAGTSVKIESDNTSGNTAFTRLGIINVATGATFHVSSGTTFIMNVLNVF